MANPRFDARSKMIWRVSLSEGARLLYLALDDMARDRGDWFIRQTDLAKRLGLSDRHMRRHIEDLTTAGHIAVSRTGRSSVYRLSWAAENPVENQAPIGRPCPIRSDADVHSDRTPASDRLLICNSGTYSRDERPSVRCACGGLIEENPAEGVRCQFCSHVHSVGCQRCEAVDDPISEGIQLLAGYVAQCGLPWGQPDADIVRRCLDATGGLVALMAGLRTLLLDRRQQPGRSWGWFPVALAGLRRRAS